MNEELKKIKKSLLFIGIIFLAVGCVRNSELETKPVVNEVPKSVSETKQPLSEKAQKQSTNNPVNIVSYKGVEGKTALELLKAQHKVETKTFSGIGEYVVSINGVSENIGKNFWAFYVNGQQAKVGAGDYKTKEGEQIEWKLEDIKAFKN